MESPVHRDERVLKDRKGLLDHRVLVDRRE